MAVAAIRLNTPIQYIKGIGKERTNALAKVGIKNVEDLLYYFPRRHLDRTTITYCKDLKQAEFATVVGKINSCGIRRFKRGKLFQAQLHDDTGFLTLVWFNGIGYIKESIKSGDILAVHGKVDFFNGFQIAHPEYDKLSPNTKPLSTGAVIPLYPLNNALNQVGLGHRSLRKVFRSVQQTIRNIPDYFHAKFLGKYNLISRCEALSAIHFAENKEQLEKAKHRLKFDEHFFLQLGNAIKKNALDKIGTKPLIETGPFAKLIYDSLDFELTVAQKRVLNEISNDLKKPIMMNRLLQGDVGCGKTIIAVLTAAIAVGNKVQVAIMAPTEILAYQHFMVFQKYAEIAQIPTALLVGNTAEKERKSILKGSEDGSISQIIGTHALIQNDINFKQLGLVIVDEQHRFGVMQRSSLVAKGQNPHFLSMTATPIPRTLSVTYFGDMDISIIDQMPKNRVPVTTTVVQAERLNKIYNFIKNEVARGQQCIVVYPLVEETEKSDLAAATEAFKHLGQDIFPQLKVGLIHGRMKKDEKEKIMETFSKNKINILVSTTVVEVGIDIPNATIMLVEHAERFGLSQLHQLRGRVGRSDKKSYCILVQRKYSDLGDKRLKIVESTNDGFKIADEDLKMRGPGVFFGTQQSGYFNFKIANLISDNDILRLARGAAFSIVKDDNRLEKSQHKELSQHFYKNYQHLMQHMGIG